MVILSFENCSSYLFVFISREYHEDPEQNVDDEKDSNDVEDPDETVMDDSDNDDKVEIVEGGNNKYYLSEDVDDAGNIIEDMAVEHLGELSKVKD